MDVYIICNGKVTNIIMADENKVLSIPIVYNTETGKPVYVNNFQIYPITSEIVIEFNTVDYKGTIKSSKNGKPTELHVDPVITLQIQKDTAMDLLQNLASLLIPQQQQQPPVANAEPVENN